MKLSPVFRPARGFTLIELMVAMTVTTMIVTVLVTITAISLDTWTRSRSEVRAARQAKSLVDTMGRDFEALVARRGTNAEWLSAVVEDSRPEGKAPAIESTNAANLIFFTAPTDRYDGDLTENNAIGDVACVGYQLKYRDPIQSQSGESVPTFVLNRLLVNPDEAYDKLISKAHKEAIGLKIAFDAAFGSDMDNAENFVCENIFQYTITLNLSVNPVSAGNKGVAPVMVPITIGSSGASATEFRLVAGKIITNYVSAVDGVTDDDIKAGNISSVEISITVLTDFGVDQMRKRTFKSETEQSEFLAKNSYQYSKLVQVPIN